MSGVNAYLKSGAVAALLGAWLLFSAGTPDARGQAADAALKDRVNQLVEKLDAGKDEARQAAQDALVKVGARVLPLLPDDPKAGTPDRRKRLDAVRVAIKTAAEVNLGASKITLQAKGMRLSEVIQKLQGSSGNAITDLREAEGAEATNPSLDLDIVDKPFLEALDMVCKLAEVVPNFSTGDGSVGIMAGAPPKGGLVVYQGPFRVVFKQVGTVRDFQADSSTANAQFEVAWEPRLRPMLLKLDAKELKIVDDTGKDVPSEVKDESTDVVLRPENPSAEMNVSLQAPSRGSKAFKSFKVKAEVTVPAGLRTFRFATLDVKEPKSIKLGDVSVRLDGTEIDEQVWKVNVVLGYEKGGGAFESYRQGLFNNRLWLQKPDGSKFEHNGGFSNTSADEGKLGFEYIFVDAPGKPGDFGLVYETPSEVKTIPLEFEFKDVPLP